jgi:TRAP-type C4-dicarboxylate transport system permease small subunit
MMTQFLVAFCSAVLSIGSTLAFQPPAAQDPFVPVDQLPPADQLPAAPLLIAAYAFVCIAVLFYVWTIWRRLNKVEEDMQALSRRSRTR